MFGSNPHTGHMHLQRRGFMRGSGLSKGERTSEKEGGIAS